MRFYSTMLMMASVGARYEKKVKDYNFGSLIRTDARQEYAEANTIFGAQSSHSSFYCLSLTWESSSHSHTSKSSPEHSGRFRPFTCFYSQFYAIEIARNRLGLNDGAHEIAKADAEKEAKEKAEKAAKKAGKKNGKA